MPSRDIKTRYILFAISSGAGNPREPSVSAKGAVLKFRDDMLYVHSVKLMIGWGFFMKGIFFGNWDNITSS